MSVVDLAELGDLERTTLTIDTPQHPDWLRVFPVAHLAEHLLGRELGRLAGLSALTGHLRQDVITVRFLVSRTGRSALDLPRLLELRDTTSADFEQELRVLAAEDAILPASLRSTGRLPAGLEQFRDAWRRTTPRLRLDREPFVSGRMRALLDPGSPAPWMDGLVTEAAEAAGGRGSASGRWVDGAADERQEYADALAAVRRRLGGREPELFMDGGPLDQYCSPASVFLAGLSAYRSPLFRRLREGPRPVYSLKLFDFPWRRRTFVACVTQPATGPAAFSATLGPRLAEIVAGLGTAELRTVRDEGCLAVLDDLVAVLDFPPRRAWLPVLARLNDFSARPTDLARPVLDCTTDDLARYRDDFLDAYTRRVHRTAWEAV
ncbi:hypothetical protein [Streptomyces sp. NPDC088254]|uniref:hypothetical protein n=1 Tax=Streptomyces sp. NPDC088254 TaxID=3365847 RepID=UPI00381A7357